MHHLQAVSLLDASRSTTCGDNFVGSNYGGDSSSSKNDDTNDYGDGNARLPGEDNAVRGYTTNFDECDNIDEDYGGGNGPVAYNVGVDHLNDCDIESDGGIVIGNAPIADADRHIGHTNENLIENNDADNDLGHGRGPIVDGNSIHADNVNDGESECDGVVDNDSDNGEGYNNMSSDGMSDDDHYPDNFEFEEQNCSENSADETNDRPRYPIHEDSDVSKSECLTLVMSFVMRHNLAGVVLTDLIELINTLLPGCLPPSKYFIYKKYLKNSSIQKYFYCQNCKVGLGCSPPSECPGCQTDIDEESLKRDFSYFMATDVCQQLRDLFQLQNLPDNLVRDRFKENNDKIEDIFDGQKYKENKNFLSNRDNISFTWNTDGVPVFESSRFSVWPIFLTINEVIPNKRKDYTILHSLWYGKQRPHMSTFLKPFVEDLSALYSDGFKWTDKHGIIHITRCIPLLATVDSVARASLQGIKQFNGEFGCSFCIHPGKVVPKGNGTTRVYPLVNPLPPKRKKNK